MTRILVLACFALAAACNKPATEKAPDNVAADTATRGRPGAPAMTLTIKGTGDLNGKVTSYPDTQIDCTIVAGVTSGTCFGWYAPEAVVFLTPTTSGSSSFGGWTGACAGFTQCMVSMDEEFMTAKAAFITPVSCSRPYVYSNAVPSSPLPLNVPISALNTSNCPTEVWGEVSMGHNFDSIVAQSAVTQMPAAPRTPPSFSVVVEGLQASTVYYIRAKARNAGGTYTGNIVMVRTEAGL